MKNKSIKLNKLNIWLTDKEKELIKTARKLYGLTDKKDFLTSDDSSELLNDISNSEINDLDIQDILKWLEKYFSNVDSDTEKVYQITIKISNALKNFNK